MTIIAVTLDEIESHTIIALEKHGALTWIAKEVAKSIRVAEAENNKICGLYYLDSYCKQLSSGRVNGQIQPEVTQPKPGSINVDAKNGFAQAAFSKGLPSAIESARKNGICLLAIAHSHTCTSLGYFTAQIAKHGLIGIGTTNAPACVSPPDGNKPVLGTNPISMSVPSEDKTVAFQFDQSTSAIAIGKIRMAAAASEAIPAGWAIDKEGRPTTDAKKALEGAMLPIGDAKGSALALMVEMLAAGLTGSNFGFEASSFLNAEGDAPSVGQLIIAIDPSFFSGESFGERTETLVGAVLEQPGTRLPGDKRIEKRKVREKSETITISKDLYEKIELLT